MVKITHAMKGLPRKASQAVRQPPVLVLVLAIVCAFVAMVQVNTRWIGGLWMSGTQQRLYIVKWYMVRLDPREHTLHIQENKSCSYPCT